MNIVSFIAFDAGTELEERKFLYKDVLPSKKTVYSENDCIFFDDSFTQQELEYLEYNFQQRDVYAIRTSVPLSFKSTDNAISEDYLTCEKEQLEWFRSFVKKYLTEWNDILFIQLDLDKPRTFYNNLSDQFRIDELDFSGDSFSFEPYEHQFVLK